MVRCGVNRPENSRIHERIQQDPGDRRAEKSVTGGYGPDGIVQVLGRAVLQQVTVGTTSHHLQHVVLIVMSGKDKNLHMRNVFLDMTRRFQTIQPGHTDVHQYNIRIQLEGEINREAAIGRFPDNFDPLCKGKQRNKARRTNRVIVCDENANWLVFLGSCLCMPMYVIEGRVST